MPGLYWVLAILMAITFLTSLITRRENPDMQNPEAKKFQKTDDIMTFMMIVVLTTVAIVSPKRPIFALGVLAIFALYFGVHALITLRRIRSKSKFE